MTVQTAKPSRREERRLQTTSEITTLAMEQVSAGGPDSVSLTAIARAMRMSTAALYRYFDSREALLAELVVAAYDSYADALEHAAGGDHTPVSRFVAVVGASRAWALAEPNAYRLIFQTTSGSGQDLAPERTIPAASRSMTVLLSALAALAALAEATGDDEDAGQTPVGPALRGQLTRWSERAGETHLPLPVLAAGFRCWSRLHGVISLEIGHHLSSTGIDAGLLYDGEVEALVREVAPGAAV